MLTVAYCRVSTEEQAAEGFSIEGQADKLRAYAALHDLGEVVQITDPGLSGKDMNRPGLRHVLEMVDRGHVSHVLVWRLDRLSRNLGDLQTLATGFVDRGVQLHSVTENLDLSSATGRMFYNILGSFAQFYREQLAENVRMGMGQAVREGRWINRPKTGYDLRDDGVLIPNDDAPRVRSIFRLRAEGLSYRDIEQRTGTNYGTVMAILKSRSYLGEVLLSGDWFPGLHEPLVTQDEFAAAHKAHTPGLRRRSRHVLAGRVRCGLCGRVAAVEYTQAGLPTFRCRHRGQGCTMPRRAATGLEKAAVLGLTLLGQDETLRAEIRRQLRHAYLSYNAIGDSTARMRRLRAASNGGAASCWTCITPTASTRTSSQRRTGDCAPSWDCSKSRRHMPQPTSVAWTTSRSGSRTLPRCSPKWTWTGSGRPPHPGRGASWSTRCSTRSHCSPTTWRSRSPERRD